MDDDDLSESASTLPWLWVIEAFAGSREISNSTLQDLIDAAPVLPDDFCENTRELVALRCLEQLSGSAHGVDRDASSSLDSRVGFDFSRSCEDVLQDILLEIPLSNLNMAGAELLKRDVYPFIMHKRAGTTKCYLEQLKDSIMDGTHPLADHIKERSGLSLQNRGYTVHVSDSKCNNDLEKDNGNSANAENMGAKENSGSLISENGNKSSNEHLLDTNLLPSKRNRVHSVDEHLMGYINEKQVCVNESDELLRNTKRNRTCASTDFGSKKENPVSQLEKEVSENSTKTVLLISEKGGHHTKRNNRASLDDGYLKDYHNRCTASNRHSDQNEVFHDESDIPFNPSMTPQHKSVGENFLQKQFESIPTNVARQYEIQHMTCGHEPWSKHEPDVQHEDPNGFQQTLAGDKAQDDTDNDCGVEISGDKVVYQGEKIDLLMKKHEDENLGMKCNEGSRLMVCDPSQETTFPIEVPEGCVSVTKTIIPQNKLGAEPCRDTSLYKTDDTVHPIEPIPTIDDDIDDTNNIQQIINESQPKQKETIAPSLNVSQKHFASDKTVVDTVNGCGSESSSDSDGYINEKTDLAAKKYEFLSSQCAFSQDLSPMTDSAEHNLCMKCNKGGQLLVCKTTTCPLAVHKNCLGVSAQLDVNGDFFCPFCAYSHAISEYLQAKKKASLARKELAIFINKRIRNQTTELVHVDGHGGDKIPCKKTNFVSANQRDSREEIPQEIMKQHNMNGTAEAVCAQDNGKEDFSGTECEKHIISKYSLRSQKHESEYGPRASPRSIRKKTPWTFVEEELIREGVQKFGVGEPKIPWKKILAFGSHVFEKDDKRRTPQELKDKWKFMCKAQTK